MKIKIPNGVFTAHLSFFNKFGKNSLSKRMPTNINTVLVCIVINYKFHYKKPTKYDLRNFEQSRKFKREFEHASNCENFASTSKRALVPTFCKQIEERQHFASTRKF